MARPGPAAVPTLTPTTLQRLEREVCLRLELARHREWLETDGFGGYASSTVHLMPTRRYHGLLTAPVPAGDAQGLRRHLFLARLEEELGTSERAFPLSTCAYAGTVHPEGFQAIESFELAPWPRWTYRVGTVRLTRELLMVREPEVRDGRRRHGVLVRYRLEGEREGLSLRLRPLLAFRAADALTFENPDMSPRARRVQGGIDHEAYGLPTLHLRVDGAPAVYHGDPLWYRGVEYAVDLARGHDGHEDHFAPGRFELALEPGGELVLAASTGVPIEDGRALWERESLARRDRVLVARERWPRSELGARLDLAADAFRVQDPAGRPGVIAGYPWFGEWGRDTFLALPGLTLARGDRAGFEAVVEGALPFLRRGLLPNIFGADPATSHYGSADAALWMVRAVRLYERDGGDRGWLARVAVPALESIAAAYDEGTDLGLCVDDEGLLHAGTAELNATWMDARVDGVPVTPRAGCPVELNALWYLLLAFLAEWHGERGDGTRAAAFGARAERTGAAFLRRFWLPEERRLADVWDGERADPSLRCNMVLAAALDLSPLSPNKRADVVEAAEAALLTPRGLRTLAPTDPRYVARYEGGPRERDAAYHQGTVWPWPLGFLVEGALRVFAPQSPRVQLLRRTVDGFLEHLEQHGMGQVAEVFDGNPPHRPGGCPAQAWSVAELLRAQALLEAAGA